MMVDASCIEDFLPAWSLTGFIECPAQAAQTKRIIQGMYGGAGEGGGAQEPVDDKLY
jgi:hypothetical protein